VPFQLIYAHPNSTNKQIYTLILNRYAKIIASLSLPTSHEELLGFT
jgi:hypothetical protein